MCVYIYIYIYIHIYIEKDRKGEVTFVSAQEFEKEASNLNKK